MEIKKKKRKKIIIASVSVLLVVVILIAVSIFYKAFYSLYLTSHLTQRDFVKFQDKFSEYSQRASSDSFEDTSIYLTSWINIKTKEDEVLFEDIVSELTEWIFQTDSDYKNLKWIEALYYLNACIPNNSEVCNRLYSKMESQAESLQINFEDLYIVDRLGYSWLILGGGSFNRFENVFMEIYSDETEITHTDFVIMTGEKKAIDDDEAICLINCFEKLRDQTDETNTAKLETIDAALDALNSYLTESI